MVAQFPETVSSPKAYLNPKINMSAKLRDVGFSSTENGTVVSRRSRVADIVITAVGLEQRFINSAIDRIFGYLRDVIVEKINIPLQPALSLKSYSEPLDKPEIELSVNADRASTDNQTIDFNLSIINLQSDFIEATFAATKEYILNAANNDLNSNL
jgi:hypothetical protein